jgi:sRNA-binding protein
MSHTSNNNSRVRTIKRRTTTVVYFERAPRAPVAATNRVDQPTAAAKSNRVSDDAARRLLRTRFPKSFGAGVPLKVGVSHELVALAGDIGLSPKQIKNALRYLTNTRHYIEQLCAPDSVRVDLEGDVVSSVTDEQRTQAVEKLNALIERRRKT